jgi:flagellin FlaB
MNSTIRSRKTRRGVIGIESAIVMIAFVIVAAALAFVVLNMGFSTTQKAKSAISNSITEASSSLEIAGKVTGIGSVAQGKLNATVIPLKIAGGGDAVNLDPAVVSIKYYSHSVRYDNIYGSSCVLTSTTYNNVTTALAAAKTATCIDQNPTGAGATAPTATKAVMYWDVSNSPQNKILDQGEHAEMAIAYDANDKPSSLDNIKVEVVVPTGSALTVERSVPSVTTSVVDLG